MAFGESTELICATPAKHNPDCSRGLGTYSVIIYASAFAPCLLEGSSTLEWNQDVFKSRFTIS